MVYTRVNNTWLLWLQYLNIVQKHSLHVFSQKYSINIIFNFQSFISLFMLLYLLGAPFQLHYYSTTHFKVIRVLNN